MINKKPIELSGNVLGIMKQCVLLQPLEPNSFERIRESSHVTQLCENEILFEQGSELTDIYLLVSGGIKLQRLAPNGDEKVIEIIRPGQTFAEAVLFSGGSRFPVSAVAVSSSVIVSIHAKTYLELLNTSNSLCMSLLAKLSQRLHWMINEVDQLTLHNATFRVVDYLLSHIPEDKKERTGVSFVAPKHVVASRLSIKPETLSRTLKDLSKRGLIHLEGAKIELLDIEQLRQLIALDT